MTNQELAEEMGDALKRLELLNKKAIRNAKAHEDGELTVQLLKRARNGLKEVHTDLWAACRSAGLNEGK